MAEMNKKQVFKSLEGRQQILQAYDNVLQNWSVAYREFDLPTPIGTTHVIACGDEKAPALVLLHGSTSNSSMWIGQVDEYSRCFRVFAIDIPGEPGKSAAVRPELKSNAYAYWLQEVLGQLGVQQASLVGISLGGWLALKFAAAYPACARKLVLLCPSGVAPQKGSFLLLTLALLPFGDWGRDRLIRIVNGGDDIPEEAIRYTRLIADHFNPRVEVMPLFSDVELGRLTMPTLLIVGDKDALLPSRKTAERLGRLLPDVTVEILPDTGHVLIGLQKRILAFLTLSDS